MPKKQKWIVAVLATILAWSTVMTVLGQLAAVAALLPSLGLLVQQIVVAFTGTETRRADAVDSPPATAGPEEPLR
ncbi:hypothetical protein OG393_00110 [Streptomyces sp. NBC_01216]|uniref:hypothetical protein n=1 Tax=Streptomyces sp. NBC_01216 TaxID=2903778 RepID=UPI002E0E14B0|nr:hypothetical protein OG393_00110 [Streptomyces sp. NBC_01216]